MFAISAGTLIDECNKLIRKHERYMRKMREDDIRRSRRATLPATATLLRPSYWDIDRGFNPYLVRANAEPIARAVNAALRSRDYRPRSPVAHTVAKPGGGERIVSVFQVVDAVVSRAVYNSLLAKNRALMSARSYAYRSDLSTHDAIQYISSEFTAADRLYVAEYDFSKYFDSISHEYLWAILDRNRFLITPAEREILRAFLLTIAMSEAGYAPAAITGESSYGLPQGTSISLFLANAAAWELDRGLERLGVGFVRYADDTLIWSHDYGQVAEAVNVLRRASTGIGAELNPKKSKGIRLFVPGGEPAEIASTSEVNFVGYRFARGKIGLRSEVVKRMKSRMEYLIWSNLLQALQDGTFNPRRVNPPLDRDYLVLLRQLQRYLYGNLTESKVREFQRGAVKRMRYPGVMSYFPLVDDLDQLQGIDGWLVSTTCQALGKRGRMLADLGVASLPTPHGLSRNALIRAEAKTSAGDYVDLTIPSVTRYSAVLRQAATLFGANTVGKGSGADEYRYMFSSF